jgi:hypothetical protein
MTGMNGGKVMNVTGKLWAVGTIAITIVCGPAHAPFGARSVEAMQFHPNLPNSVEVPATQNFVGRDTRPDSAPKLNVTFFDLYIPGHGGHLGWWCNQTEPCLGLPLAHRSSTSTIQE